MERCGGEIRQRRRRERDLEGLLRMDIGVGISGGRELRIVNLAESEVTEGGAGVFEGGGVGGVCGGEGVASGNSFLHVTLAFFASRHRFLVLDLGLVATHRDRDASSSIGFQVWSCSTLLHYRDL